MSALDVANRRGIRLIALAMAAFVLNDSLVKHVSESLPAGQLICVRSLVASTLAVLVIVGPERARMAAASGGDTGGAAPGFGALLHRYVLARAAIDAVGSTLYLYALFHLPIANATAINLASPLFITLLAVVLVKERVGVDRWLATGVGFAGVLAIIQPATEGFNEFALIALGATLLHAIRDVMTRFIPPGIPASIVMLANSISVALFAGAWSLVQGWAPMSWRQFGLLGLAAVLVATGYWLLIRAMRVGELSVIAPFRYSALLWALLIGFVVWGNLPNLLAWIGIGLLVGAGLYLFWTDRLRRRRAADATARADAAMARPRSHPD
ncbi:MAG: DMT family transporter [Lautropia sp.]